MATADFAPGHYAYVPGVFQYSAGAHADPGHHIERYRFRRPIPLKAGFETIAGIIKGRGLPLTRFCACELRSPKPFSDQGFKSFNELYVETLAAWGIYKDGVNPVARSNVCPEIAPPPEPSFHAFSLVVDGETAAPSFVIAGSGEAREGGATYAERTVRHGDTSPEAMREKAAFVVGQMEARMGAFGRTWADTTATQVYTVFDIHPFLGDLLVARGAAPGGIDWHFNRPPVVGLDYEMDCRSVPVEYVT